ncbi:MAG: hypothetical protein N4A33_10170 [Bacteriovoracaceae bacterium]|jgi:serine/threonine protein kinase|nr:hypothetical protein [Bacteriovoracaceae bacterium]
MSDELESYYGYRIIKRVGEGGQGIGFKVSNADNEIYFLKKLKNCESLEKRKRFHREVSICKTLDF